MDTIFPKVVKAVAWLSVVGGIIGLIASVPVVLSVGLTRPDLLPFLVFSGGMTVLQIIAGLGLLRLKNWAAGLFVVIVLLSPLSVLTLQLPDELVSAFKENIFTWLLVPYAITLTLLALAWKHWKVLKAKN